MTRSRHDRIMSHPLFRLDKAPCPCGSGLRQARCCRFDAAAGPDPDHHGALDSLAETMRQARAAGRNREAERQALTLLDLAPLHRTGLRILFEIRRDEERLAAAGTLIKRLASLDPPDASLHLQHAQLLVKQGRHAEAEAPARAALLLAPRDAVAHHLAGIVFTEMGRLLPGEQHYRLALGLLEAPDVTVLGNLAWNLKLQGRLAEAAALYDTVLDRPPGTLRSLAGAAQLHAALGDFDRAAALLAAARGHAPDNRTIGLLDAILHLRRSDAAGSLALLEATAKAIAPQPLTAPEYMAKGQALERLGRDADAFTAYRAGRAAQSAGNFHPAPLEARAQALRAVYMAERLAVLPRPKPMPGEPLPVFLLGPRRSGTSLLEQMLCLAPGVDPADERAPLNDLVTLLPKLVAGLNGIERPYPAALLECMAGEAREVPAWLAVRYYTSLRASGVITAETRLVTDRSPDLVWTLGLASLLFQEAPVIHLLRHPLDVVLSGFTEDRLFEASAGATLESLARLYDIQMSMISHFRGQMTLRYLPVRYEDLVADPAAELARIFRFIGIDADAAAVLATTPRPVPRAPSYQILREPPHRRGLYRHRKFGPIFGEIMPLLSPWIGRLGYDQAARQAA
jgi:Flp pilus assembly protein TadD